MDKELLKRASYLNSNIDELARIKRRLQANAMPSSNLRVVVNQCYGDFGRSFTNTEDFKGKIAEEIYSAVMRIIDANIEQFESELSSL